MRLEAVVQLALMNADQNAPKSIKHVKFQGFDIAIEYPAGVTRELKNAKGEVVYRKRMVYSYGFIATTKGRDGDEVDVMLGPSEKAQEAHVVHMIDLGPDVDQREDEDKVMLGFPDAEAAKKAFEKHYPATFYGGMTSLPLDVFRKRLKQLPGKKITAGVIHCVQCEATEITMSPDTTMLYCRGCGMAAFNRLA